MGSLTRTPAPHPSGWGVGGPGWGGDAALAKPAEVPCQQTLLESRSLRCRVRHA